MTRHIIVIILTIYTLVTKAFVNWTCKIPREKISYDKINFRTGDLIFYDNYTTWFHWTIKAFKLELTHVTVIVMNNGIPYNISVEGNLPCTTRMIVMPLADYIIKFNSKCVYKKCIYSPTTNLDGRGLELINHFKQFDVRWVPASIIMRKLNILGDVNKIGLTCVEFTYLFLQALGIVNRFTGSGIMEPRFLDTGDVSLKPGFSYEPSKKMIT